MPYPTQDPKFQIEISGEDVPELVGQSGPIPVDEPIFIIRARDVLAVDTLVEYRRLALRNGKVDSDHLQAINKRLIDFLRFANEHPDRMKVPDTDLSKLTPLPK